MNMYRSGFGSDAERFNRNKPRKREKHKILFLLISLIKTIILKHIHLHLPN